VWRYSPELTAFLLADQRTFADVRHVANARSVAKIIAQPSLVTADSDARAWGIGDEVDLAASGQPQVLTSVPRAMGGATALLNECVAAPTPPPGHAVMGGVIRSVHVFMLLLLLLFACCFACFSCLCAPS